MGVLDHILPVSHLLLCVYSYSNSSYTEVLDSTRIHPETYEWARKMAVDALEIEEVPYKYLYSSVYMY